MALMFGDYRLVRRLATGGMGEVYLAVLQREGGFEKTVALKMMLPEIASLPGFASLFESEAAVAAILNHANIIQIFDYGNIEGRPFLTMELVEGPDLSSLIESAASGPLPEAVTAEIGTQLCRGLAHAHGRRDLEGRPVGIVHGDISPPNILLSSEGQVKLADFGLARLRSKTTDCGPITGKYSYMSPEQASGEALVPQSDLFSLGLVLYELYTGQRAYQLLDPPAATLEAVCRGDHRPAREIEPRLPQKVDDFLNRCLSHDPRDRFGSAAEMAHALNEASPSCGPDELSGFIAKHLPPGRLTEAAAPEPTEMAARPVNTGGFGGRAWKLSLVGLFVLAWGLAFAWWAIHSPPQTPRPPPQDSPRPPKKFRIRAGTDPDPASGAVEATRLARQPEKIGGRTYTEKPPKPVNRPGPATHPAHEPMLVVEIGEDFEARIDHRAVSGSTFDILQKRPYLVRISPRGASRPEVTARLEPSGSKDAPWLISLRSTPWLKISLNGQPAGQTPRSKIKLQVGSSKLELHRGDMHLVMTLETGRAK